MEKWEYQSIKLETEGLMGGIVKVKDLDYELNRLGEQGWELVSCFSTNEANGRSREVIAIFKRKK